MCLVIQILMIWVSLGSREAEDRSDNRGQTHAGSHALNVFGQYGHAL